MIKYGIKMNNGLSKIHAVIDWLFFGMRDHVQLMPCQYHPSAVARGGAGGARAPPSFFPKR